MSNTVSEPLEIKKNESFTSDMYLEEISKYIFTTKYARYNEKLGRREVWSETVDRVLEMHLKRYDFVNKDDKDKIKWAFDMVREKRVVPSMRALEDSTLIITKNGWKTVGEIIKEDILFDSQGRETQIVDIVSFKEKPLYKITFSDKSELVACAEHLWIVSTSDDRELSRTRVVDTLFLLNHLKSGDKNNISIKNPEPLRYQEKDLKVDPYVLGLWLGDGFSSGTQFASGPEDSSWMKFSYEKLGFAVRLAGTKNGYAYNVKGLKESLVEYNLVRNKHVPQDFLHGSIEQRVALLQGLMDTDGCCSDNGRCLFSNTNKNLLSGVKEILSSLGVTYTESDAKKELEHHKVVTTISFFPTVNVFRLPRKQKKLGVRLSTEQNDRTRYRRIVGVELIGCGNATCFHVNSSDHSFLAGKEMIVTHNSLQFGGKAIEAHECRIFNCCVRHVDSIRSFAEIFYLLLCGSGVGIGLSKAFLNRLPDLVSAEDKTGIIVTYVIGDSIEQWADSVEALLLCYFKSTPYTGRKITFDYSRIRKKGTPLKTGGGKAPGYRGLKYCHLKIKGLLDHIIEYKGQNRLKSIDAYDILMHCADAVLSGGVRRSACSVVFDKDDEDMLNAKTYFKVSRKKNFDEDGTQILGGKTYKLYTGKVIVEGTTHDVEIQDWEYEKLKKENIISWRHIQSQRARSNNSVLLLRGEITQEEFNKIVERTRQFGEPAFVFGDHPWQLFNPCVSGETEILTDKGHIPIKDLVNKDVNVWNGWEWSNVTPKITGYNQPMLRIGLSDGRTLKCTYYHNWIISTDYSGGKVKKKAIDLKVGDKLIKYTYPIISEGKSSPNAYTQGFIAGDGMDDYDFFWLYETKFVCTNRLLVNGCDEQGSIYENINGVKRRVISLGFHPFPKDFVPLDWDLKSKLEWLAGLFDADGTELKEGGVQLVSINSGFLLALQKLLSLCGVQSKIVDASEAGYRILPDGKGGNKEYFCQDSKRICVGSTQIQFLVELGLKCERLAFNKTPNRDASQFVKIISIENAGIEDVVYCFNEPKRHYGIFNGILTGQCFEIGFIPVTKDGVCGVQTCNLTSMNGRLIDSEEKFKECIEAATIIGTLQAGYTNFKYLSKTSKDLTEEEALLGVSITGMMENPDILLSADIQRKMSKLAVEVNKEWAKKLNIKQAARVTCLKPEGTTSLFLGCSSGIHPHHARKYFRRIQNNKIDNVYKYFKKHNPHMCEPSVWSATQTDDIIIFPIEVLEKVMIKTDLIAIEHLKIIKSTQENWVIPGTTDVNTKPITHNISCTVVVKDDEWEEVIKYIYENKQFFTAVSLLSASGDKDYLQAPMEAVITEDDKRLWNEITSKMKAVDYSQLKEDDDKTNLQMETPCVGGACLI